MVDRFGVLGSRIFWRYCTCTRWTSLQAIKFPVSNQELVLGSDLLCCWDVKLAEGSQEVYRLLNASCEKRRTIMSNLIFKFPARAEKYRSRYGMMINVDIRGKDPAGRTWDSLQGPVPVASYCALLYMYVSGRFSRYELAFCPESDASLKACFIVTGDVRVVV
jgi:hypothetical protein